MRIKSSILTAASAAALMGCLSLSAPALAADAKAMTPAEEGKQIAFDRKKGNCLACHQVEGGNLPGNIGPPLLAMKMRFPDKQKLFDQVWDARTKNPNSIMPPMGPHGILTKEEVEKVVDFIYTL